MQTPCHGAEDLSHCSWMSELFTHPHLPFSSPFPYP
jgi:hypothetical protein